MLVFNYNQTYQKLRRFPKFIKFVRKISSQTIPLTMNSQHLTTGESCPPAIPGSMRIFSMRFCPFAQRALLVAAAKGIKYNVVNINLTNKPEFLFLKNPDGLVPIIELEDGRTLSESLIVSDFLDEAFPTSQPSGGDAENLPLNPEDPFLKAQDKIWVERFGKIRGIDLKLYMNPNIESDQVKVLMEQLNAELIIFDKELQRRGTKFFAGKNKPGMLDLMIWPWMERLPSLRLIFENEASILEKGRVLIPTLVQWEENMIQDGAIQPSYFPPEIHAQYRKMRRSCAKIDYDFLHHKS